MTRDRNCTGLGIVLSGGGAMGFAHLGAFQSLEEHRIRPCAISGTSMGALTGAFLAAGYTARETYDIVRSERFDKLATILTPALLPFSGMGLSSHKNVYEVLRKYIPHDSFDELPIYFSVCATDLTTRECRYFSSGKGLHDAVIASSSIPGVFQPVRIGDGLFIDGGVIDNMPASVIRDKCSVLLGIDVNPLPKTPPAPDNTFEIIVQTIHTIIHTTSKEGRKLCDHLIEPRVNDRYNAFSFKNFDDIYREGYETMNRFLGGNYETAGKLAGLH